MNKFSKKTAKGMSVALTVAVVAACSALVLGCAPVEGEPAAQAAAAPEAPTAETPKSEQPDQASPGAASTGKYSPVKAPRMMSIHSSRRLPRPSQPTPF